jgi:ankyrin repeat protein
MTGTEFLDAIKQGNAALIETSIENTPELVNDICEDSNHSAFEIALSSGFSKVANILIECPEFDINLSGHNPLRLAIGLGFIDIAQRLLKKGANPNYRPQHMSSPLLLCLENEYFDLAELMVEKGAELDIRNDKGWTPLIWAAIKGRKTAVEFLLKHGVNVNVLNNDGWNAITGAYFKKRTDVVALLKGRGAVFSAKFSESALLSSFEDDNFELVENLLKLGVSSNIQDANEKPLLLKAIEAGNRKSVELLITHNVELNSKDKKGVTPLLKAIELGNIYLVKALINAGASLAVKNASGESVLHLATKYKQLEILILLVESGAEQLAIDKLCYSVIQTASRHLDSKGLEYLLSLESKFTFSLIDGLKEHVGEALYKPSYFEKTGVTTVINNTLALDTSSETYKSKLAENVISSVQNGSLKRLVNLVNKYDLKYLNEIKDEDHNSLLSLTYKTRNIDMFILLIEKGLDLDVTDKEGIPVLNTIAKHNDIEAATLLIEAGANINIRAKDGRTPLQVAVIAKNIEMVDLLISKDCDLNIMDEDHRTATILVSRRLFLAGVKLLLSSGANTNICSNNDKIIDQIGSSYKDYNGKYKSLGYREIEDEIRALLEPTS